MFKRFFPLLLSLVLCGCAAQNPPQKIQSTPASLPDTAPARLVLQERSPAELPVGLTACTLSGSAVSGIVPLGDTLLLFQAEGSHSHLSAVSGGAVTAERTLDFVIGPEDCTRHNGGKALAYFEREAMQMVLLNNGLEEIRRIDVPEDLMGTPLLSKDGSTLFYCTPDSLRALETGSGISRLVKEMAYPFQSVSRLLLQDTVVQLQVEEGGQMQTFFLAADTGKLLSHRTDSPEIVTNGSVYAARLHTGAGSLLLFAEAEEMPMLLTPRFPEGACAVLTGNPSAVTYCPGADGETILDLYDLESGMLVSSVSVGQEPEVQTFCRSADGCVWFLAGSGSSQTLFRWDPALTACQEDTRFCEPYHTRQSPDPEGLEECGAFARQLSEAYGVEILIHEEAAAHCLQGYALESEYLVPVLQHQLEQLDSFLGKYPKGFLKTLMSDFSGLKIHLVRQILETPESGGSRAVSGLLYWEGHEAHILLSCGSSSRQDFYSTICQLMETRVLTASTAYDQWEALNPSGFVYGAVIPSPDSSLWMEPGQEVFWNEASMHSPADDRAQIMAAAMTDGNADRFRSPYLQAKLHRLCTGIREAFDLSDHSEPLLWEQYLQTP